MKIHIIIMSLSLAVCFLCSCAASQKPNPHPSEPAITPVETPFELPTPSPKPTLPPLSDVRIESYQMEKYVEGQVSIEYPVFEGENCEQLNALVYGRIYQLATENEYESIGGEIIVDMQSEVTFIGKYIVSIIFWGEARYNVSMHSGDMLIALNIDLYSMKDLPITTLYNTADKQLPFLFSQYAHFPSGPVTSYPEERFEELKKHNFTTNKFGLPDLQEQPRFFLRPDGLVFSYISVHAHGHDHFEAQMDYDVLVPLYLGPDGYFEEADSQIQMS